GTPSAEAARKGLAIARAAESHAIEFYAEAAGVVDDGSTKRLLAELEAEERIHLGRIETLLADAR
ncbi:MAG TPA: hypothetical protein VFF01_07590, partial [Candidatus Deferrimicrobiaceae bacterium]|nr:hypothetical protein [Candidatus Deferrimicrobiaceae bacterium]